MTTKVTDNPILAVVDELLRLQGCFEEMFEGMASAAGMSTLQKLVLFAVFEARVPPTVPQIGRDLGHPRQVIQRIVNELVEADILARQANPHHKRAMLLVPTQKAQAMKRQAEDRAVATAQGFLLSFAAQRCTALTGELRALREALEAHLGRSVEDRANTSALALIDRLG